MVCDIVSVLLVGVVGLVGFCVRKRMGVSWSSAWSVCAGWFIGAFYVGEMILWGVCAL